MVKPKSIRSFELFWWGATFFWAVARLLAWDGVQGGLSRRFRRAVAADESVAVVAANAQWVALALVAIATVLLWWLVARRRSVTGKWLVAAAGALSLVQAAVGAYQLLTSTHRPLFTSSASLASFALTILAAWMLFRSDARAWFLQTRRDAVEELAA